MSWVMTAQEMKDCVEQYDDGAITACELVHICLRFIAQDAHIVENPIWNGMFEQASVLWRFYFSDNE